MQRILSACAIAALMGVGAAAQDRDTTVKSKTEIKTDDASVVSMTGCLRRDIAGNYTLLGTAVKGRDGITTETKVRTENDRDESKVTTEARTRVEDGRVGTSGALTTFIVMPREGLVLLPHIGQQVQIAAVMVDPDHKDAEVKIEEKTSVDPGRGEDRTKRSKTEVEIDGDASLHYTVVSVKPLGSACR
jgi:hypothetical protein